MNDNLADGGFCHIILSLLEMISRLMGQSLTYLLVRARVKLRVNLREKIFQFCNKPTIFQKLDTNLLVYYNHKSSDDGRWENFWPIGKKTSFSVRTADPNRRSVRMPEPNGNFAEPHTLKS